MLFKSNGPSVDHRWMMGVLLAFPLMGACSGNGANTWADPEPRVATFDGSDWTVAKRPSDLFTTYTSLFGESETGWPVAIRDLGGDLYFGRWTGTDWDPTLIGTLPTTSDSDQLFSGMVTVDVNGLVHALFVTLSNQMYYAGQLGENGAWVINEILGRGLACYDIALGPDGTPHLLTVDTALDLTVISVLQADLVSNEVEVPDVSGACGSLSISEQGDIAVALLVPDSSGLSNDGTIELHQLPAPLEGSEETTADAWTSEVIATDAAYECASCYIPELAYRGDGRPVLMYISSTNQSIYLVDQDDSDVFNRHTLSSFGQVAQLTRLKRAPDGSLATVVILDQMYVKLGVSQVGSEDSFTYTTLTTPAEASTPRLAWTGAGAFISFWDLDGVWASVPTGDAYEAFRVDDNANQGAQLGGYIAVGPDGIPQIFYNEWHLEE